MAPYLLFEGPKSASLEANPVDVAQTTETTMKHVKFRPFAKGDLTRLQEIRKAAYAPIFASIREVLGERLHNPDRDTNQADLS